MADIALLLDEDVRVLLGEILRQRGYDVIHVLEVDREGSPTQNSSNTQPARNARFLLTTFAILYC
jgi:hypothetical protein